MQTIRKVLLSLFILGAFSPGVRAESKKLSARLNASELLITGLTPGGRTVILGALVHHDAYFETEERRYDVLTDGDSDGSVILPIAAPGPYRGAWIVFDFESGDSTSISTHGEQRPLRGPANFLPDNQNRLKHLELWQAGFAEVIWLRPGVGAWAAVLNDGAANDRDGRHDGRGTFEVTAFKRVAGEADAPDEMANGDLFGVIDAFELRSSVITVRGH